MASESPRVAAVEAERVFAVELATLCESSLLRAGRMHARRMILCRMDSSDVADLLRSESRLVRLKALYMVGTLNMSSLAQNVCETLLHDACPVVRHEAAYQLGVLKPAGALSALCQALVEDPEELVRHEAAEALGELGDRDAFPWLERACRDTSESVRATAAIAREEIEVIAAARDAIGFAADREYEGSVVQAA